MKLILKINYQKFATDDMSPDVLRAMMVLRDAIPVEEKYIDRGRVYVPSETNENLDIEMIFVENDQVRQLTGQEENNKALDEAKMMKKFLADESAKKDETIRQLQCEIDRFKTELTSSKRDKPKVGGQIND